MKVTDELKNKIKHAVKAKYADELAANKSNIAVLEATLIADVTKEIQELCNEHPRLATLLNVYSINYSNQIRNFLSRFDHGTALTEAGIKQCNLLDKMNNEIDNLLVTVSYGKDIEDIKKAFGEYGLKF